MKKDFNISKSILTLATVSSMVLLNGAMSSVVEADNIDVNTSINSTTGNFSFTATIVDSNGSTLSGKTVTLTDITDGTEKVLQTLTSNNQGQAVFYNLPLNRNISVSVDGKVKGYTVRTSQADSKLATSFVADGVGQGAPVYSSKSLDVYVTNQDGEPVVNKEVTLKDRSGNPIGHIQSDSRGLAHFTSNLLDGTFYQFYIDGKRMGETIPGISVTTALNIPESANSVNTSPSSEDNNQSGSFFFTVTILGEDGKVVEGKNVALFDITDGKEVALKDGKSNKDGQVYFDQLPLSRNISVSVDGKTQGYTIRTDQDGQKKAAAFYVSGNGSSEPNYSKTPLTISVVDENAEPISGQIVTLVNKLGKKVAETTSDKSGKAIFSDGLMDGMFYDFYVNGIKMNSVTPGNSISAALSNDQILKELPEEPENRLSSVNNVASVNDQLAEDETSTIMATTDEIQNEPSRSSRETAQKQETAQSQETSQKVTPMLKQSQAQPQQKQSKVLPETGEKMFSILTLVGLVSVAISSIIFIGRKSIK